MEVSGGMNIYKLVMKYNWNNFHEQLHANDEPLRAVRLTSITAQIPHNALGPQSPMGADLQIKHVHTSMYMRGDSTSPIQEVMGRYTASW